MIFNSKKRNKTKPFVDLKQFGILEKNTIHMENVLDFFFFAAMHKDTPSKKILLCVHYRRRFLDYF